MATMGMWVEIKVKCEACGAALPVNALAAEVPCASCNQSRRLDPGAWKAILEDALKDAPLLDVGAEQKLAIMASGAGAVELRYGHQDPRCVACSTAVEPDDLAGLAARGFGFCTRCGARMSFRRVPAGVAPLVPEDAILVGEQLTPSGGPGGAHAAGPAPTPVELPTPARWWLWFDAAEHPVEWNNLEDVVVDGHGNLYCIAAMGDAVSDNRLLSLDPQLRLRWSRKDVTVEDDARLSLNPTGHLVVGDKRQRALLVLSCADGATVAKVGGTAHQNMPGVLDFEDADAFAVDTDGTIIVLARSCFRRFTSDGREVAPWPGVRPARFVEDCATGIDELRPQPVNFRTKGAQVSIGWDGFTYLESDEKVAKLDHQGRLIYATTLQLADVRGRPRAPTNGWLNVLGKLPREELGPLGLDEAFALVIVSPDGRQQRRFLLDQGMGGPLGTEDHLAVTPEGFIWLLDYGGRARLLGPDGGPRFVSEQSHEADEERRRARPVRPDDR